MPEPPRRSKSRIKRFKWDRRVFTLRRPIEYEVSYEEGVWIYESRDLGLVSYDRTKAKAEENFNEDFAALWDRIALADDSKLTRRAVELKRRLNELVVNVK